MAALNKVAFRRFLNYAIPLQDMVQSETDETGYVTCQTKKKKMKTNICVNQNYKWANKKESQFIKASIYKFLEQLIVKFYDKTFIINL